MPFNKYSSNTNLTLKTIINSKTNKLSRTHSLALSHSRRKIKKTAMALAFSFISSTASLNALALNEANSEFYINDAEAIIFIEKDSDALSQKSTALVNQIKQLSFYAHGREFNLELSDNTPISSRFASRLKNVNLYRGTVNGAENSWVRINEKDGQYSGAIFDGQELYMLDSIEAIAGAMADTSKVTNSASQTVLYKAADVTSAAICGDHGEDELALNSLLSKFKQRSQNVSSTAQTIEGSSVIAGDEPPIAAEASQQVNVRIVVDTQYVASSANGAETQVLEQMNIVDGIFSEQVGVQFGISEIDVLNNNGSLNSNNAGTLLNQFRNFVGNDNPGLAHLFTGRNINGGTIGVAYLSALCTTNGVGVTQAGGRGTLGALTIAHEFGHNFGAPHDNQNGSVCASTGSGFLMNPSLNGSQQFSACSLGQISNVLNSSRSSCLVDLVTPTPTITPAPTPVTTPAPTTPTPTPVTGCNLSTSFNNGANNFSFIDDNDTPAYSSGSVSNGALNVLLGGVDNNDITNIQGTWRYRCEQDSTSTSTITLNAILSQSSEFESDEISQLALRVNGDVSLLATLAGNGNGGNIESTGTTQYQANVTLPAGDNIIDLICFNNKKTLNDESTLCSINDLSIESSNNTGTTNVINADFDSDFAGFNFNANTDYAEGNLASNGSDSSGSLQTVLGGIDNSDTTNMVGNWSYSFNTRASSYSLSLDANLTQSSEYEADEVSRIGVIIDGQLQILNQINGDGNGGNTVGTGLQSYELDLNLNEGSHEIGLYCFNGKKTFANEITTCSFDNIRLD